MVTSEILNKVISELKEIDSLADVRMYASPRPTHYSMMENLEIQVCDGGSVVLDAAGSVLRDSMVVVVAIFKRIRTDAGARFDRELSDESNSILALRNEIVKKLHGSFLGDTIVRPMVLTHDGPCTDVGNSVLCKEIRFTCGCNYELPLGN